MDDTGKSGVPRRAPVPRISLPVGLQGVGYGEELRGRPTLTRQIYISSRALKELRKTQGGTLLGWVHPGGAVVGHGDDGSTPIGQATLSPPDASAAGYAWLALTPEPAGYLRDGDQWLHVPLTVVDTDSENFIRGAGLSRLDVLASRTVVVVGCGSVGGSVADDLSHQGVGKFILIDLDVFEARNIGRHRLDWSATGSSKVHALAQRLRRVNPGADVVAHFEDALSPDFALEAMIAQSDLVVCSPDSGAVRSLVNRICVSVGTPLVSCGFYEHAAASEVIFVWPGQTSCVRCIHSESHDTDSTSDVPYAGADQVPGAPGLSIDIAFGANIAASVAQATLDPFGARFAGLNPQFNWLRAHSGQLPSEEWRGHFSQPFDVVWCRNDRNPDCGHCGSGVGATEYRERIRQRAGLTGVGDVARLPVT